MASNPGRWYRKLFPTAHRLLLERIIQRRLPRLTGETLVIGAGHDPYSHLLTRAGNIYRTDICDQGGMIDTIIDAHQLPFPDESFDAIVALEVLEHLSNPHRAVREMQRVLRQDGWAFLSAPLMFGVHGDPYDFTRFTEDGLKRLFGQFSVSTIAIGGRVHVISDVLTTVGSAAAVLRLFNHLLALPGIRSPSEDCPTGYWVEARKV